MCCRDGIGQGWLGLGIAVCSGKEEFPPAKGEEESLCRTPFGRKRKNPHSKVVVIVIVIVIVIVLLLLLLLCRSGTN